MTVKERDKDKKLSRKTICHILAEETVNFKRSTFFASESEMPLDMCAFMKQDKVCRHPIKFIWQDNAGEYKKLITLACLKDWKYDKC
jgi:hypothetical protein